MHVRVDEAWKVQHVDGGAAADGDDDVVDVDEVEDDDVDDVDVDGDDDVRCCC